jgi:hypothetical protein
MNISAHVLTRLTGTLVETDGDAAWAIQVLIVAVRCV